MSTKISTTNFIFGFNILCFVTKIAVWHNMKSYVGHIQMYNKKNTLIYTKLLSRAKNHSFWYSMQHIAFSKCYECVESNCKTAAFRFQYFNNQSMHSLINVCNNKLCFTVQKMCLLLLKSFINHKIFLECSLFIHTGKLKNNRCFSICNCLKTAVYNFFWDSLLHLL